MFCFKRTLATAFMWHNYGKSTIGAKSDLENVPIDRLQAFYKKYYQPDNAVLMVAGKDRRSEDTGADPGELWQDRSAVAEVGRNLYRRSRCRMGSELLPSSESETCNS